VSVDPPTPPVAGVAFLLAQLGAYASSAYAARVSELDLTPAMTGILRFTSMQPGLSQQALANLLNMAPSKLVSVLDGLEKREVLERRRNAADRRNYQLFLTNKGQELMAEIRIAAQDHENLITEGLTSEERKNTLEGLQKIASRQGLTPGVHPGYRRL
jgi:DNA-binding MarR family transcriptional regulator